MDPFPGFASLPNRQLLDELYQKYRENPESVDPSWRPFFEGLTCNLYAKQEGGGGEGPQAKIVRIRNAYRKWGHLQASFNPLDSTPKKTDELSLQALQISPEELSHPFPTLGLLSRQEAPLKEILEALEAIYCGSIGFECTHLENRPLEEFLAQKIEARGAFSPTAEERRKMFEGLARAEQFEAFIHFKYVGQKRFSLEGGDLLIPLLQDVVARGTELGLEEVVMGMAHRGRLNVLTHVLGKSYKVIFEEFNDLPSPWEGSGDVKYHLGYSSSEGSVALHLAANSSCLEAVDPIVLGEARGRQEKRGGKASALLIHGDAALAGQGVVYESLQMGKVDGFSIGGALHFVVNNQVGFTTAPREARSTRYCTDIAKTFGAPVFHLHGEDPEGALFATRLALEVKVRFGCDVFLDLNCYRKYGHNEGDEPVYTQPLEVKTIQGKKSPRALYQETLVTAGVLTQQQGEEIVANIKRELEGAFEAAKQSRLKDPVEEYGRPWGEQKIAPKGTLFTPVATAVEKKRLQEVADASLRLPTGFSLHPKLQKWGEERKEKMGRGEGIDWGLAETLAFGSLLLQGVPVRLVGQDVRRGTFSHRHVAFYDQKSGIPYLPLTHLSKTPFQVHNTILSEFASLAFEYGYSWATPEGLTLWEAQFGDFVIGAETPIDHYLAAAETKWHRTSPLVLLLPHGYEGQGPEHSSARIERFLQLAAEENLQIAVPTTPANYFHLLRRQALREIKKPLVVFAPKSLLRHPECVSSLDDFALGGFEEVLPDRNPPKKVKQLFLMAGKIYYDLLPHREKFPDAALVRLEQIYPLPLEKLTSLYPDAKEWIWVQEEPQNMGAWTFLKTHFPQELRYVGRPESAATATGSPKKHKQEFENILKGLTS